MRLTNWQILSDQGPDLVACLDFPGARGAAGFADLADGAPLRACFVQLRQATAGPLPVALAQWAAELTGTGRPVRAVLGYCTGAALATRLADAIAESAPAPVVVLLDALGVDGWSLVGEFLAAVESSARNLTTDALAEARALADHLVATDPEDLPGIGAAVTACYGRLMREVADRLSLPDFLYRQLTAGFTAYVDYLLLAGQGGFDTRASAPLFLVSAGLEPPVPDGRTLAFDVGHDDLLREPKVHELVADLIRGETPC